MNRIYKQIPAQFQPFQLDYKLHKCDLMLFLVKYVIAIAAISGGVVVTVVANNDMQSRRKVIQYEQNISGTYMQCTSVYVCVC